MEKKLFIYSFSISFLSLFAKNMYYERFIISFSLFVDMILSNLFEVGHLQ